MEINIEDQFPKLSQLWNVPASELKQYYSDLTADAQFLKAINEKILDVPAFGGKQFTHVSEMRAYRSLMYLAVRVYKPSFMIETGVHNGMGSAFILLGMHHNKSGALTSIDLPPVDQRILDQGTNPLPKDKIPGWIIPEYLKDRHDLRLGEAQTVLPALLAEKGSVDIFLHDSDHSYQHIMFEVAISWHYLKDKGLVMIDNIEQNEAFNHFAAGVGAPSCVIDSFNGPDRLWQHGLIVKSNI